jgi:AhpD family alkylhydroperoxidase
VVEVDYPPDAASPPHTHAKSAFIYAYVLSGRIESKVNDSETRIYEAGESWSEPPNARHQVAAMRARPKRPGCSRCSSWTPATWRSPPPMRGSSPMTQRLDYNQVAPDGAKAHVGVYGYVLQSGLPAELVDLVYLGVSQINNCAYCLDMHARAPLRTRLPPSWPTALPHRNLSFRLSGKVRFAELPQRPLMAHSGPP